ncbi:hypothetical protein C1H46_033078 [Malus baccata]|uniref:Protein kinase domain-containing protein n=1 Tax=Malus baccata TaxID=106549 RepID=A0A540L4F7_MALBA|nr:hypothetical protein C1H46_033078 [Malus baccata]
MILIDHPNLLKAYCSFTAGGSLWIVTPYVYWIVPKCLHIMKSAHPNGSELPVIATLLHAALNGLAYLHYDGHIQRDTKVY